MKPYQQIPINECGEPLVPIPGHPFVLSNPHPYVALGAPYGEKSPNYLREEVLQRLLQAQDALQAQKPGWRLQIFDAYRPIVVQQFMVDHAYGELLQHRNLAGQTLTESERQALLQEVYQFWAVPSDDPGTPPPHSTGAALDVTLLDEAGQPVEMGSPIDELSPRSYPDYFAPYSPHRPSSDESSEAECDRFHRNRQCLDQVMEAAGFQRHPNEWWHFSFGDQMWAWLIRQSGEDEGAIARYGRI